MEQDENNTLDIGDLDIDVSDVSTEFPSAPVGDLRMIIRKVAVVPFSKKPEHAGKRSLQLSLTNEEDMTTFTGEQLAAGKFSQFYRINLFQSEHEAALDYRIPIARLTQAVFGEKRPLNSETVSEMVDCVVIATFKVAKDETYGKTEIKGIKAAV